MVTLGMLANIIYAHNVWHSCYFTNYGLNTKKSVVCQLNTNNS